MPKPQLYVFLSDSKIRVTKAQKQFIDEYRTRRGISISKAVRDTIEHTMECPFFNGNYLTNEKNPPVRPDEGAVP